MKKFILPIILAVTALSGQAFGWVGGPFDNGFHSASLERNSIYQAVLSMKNGNGYCYFSPTQQLVPEGASATAIYDFRGNTRNRSVIYYKGITYVGSAMGMVDGEARYLQCDINATSELGFQASTTTTQNNLFNQQQTVASVQTTIVNSNRSFTLNGSWTAKAYQTAPSFRFRGTGELVFLAPTSVDSVAGLAYTAYQGLINAIITFVASSQVTTGFNPALFTQAQTAINDALAGLTPYLGLGGVDSTYDNAKKVFIRVNGTRRYL